MWRRRRSRCAIGAALPGYGAMPKQERSCVRAPWLLASPSPGKGGHRSPMRDRGCSCEGIERDVLGEAHRVGGLLEYADTAEITRIELHLVAQLPAQRMVVVRERAEQRPQVLDRH